MAVFFKKHNGTLPGAVLLLLIAGATLCGGMHLHHIIAFNHDWAWPPTPWQAIAEFQSSIAVVNAVNYGALNYYPFSAPYTAIVAALELTFGAVIGLDVFLLGSTCVAALGAYRLARRVHGSRAQAMAASAAYIALPVVASELAAGHLAYLVAYATFPFAVESLIRLGARHDARALLALCAVAPFVAVQPQFVVFTIIVGTAVAGVSRRRLAVLFAMLAPLALNPFALVLASSQNPVSALSFDAVNAHYLAANSVEPGDAFALLGYEGRYDERAPIALRLLTKVAAAVLIANVLLAARRDVIARAIGIAGVIGYVLMCGSRGIAGAAHHRLIRARPRNGNSARVLSCKCAACARLCRRPRAAAAPRIRRKRRGSRHNGDDHRRLVLERDAALRSASDRRTCRYLTAARGGADAVFADAAADHG